MIFQFNQITLDTAQYRLCVSGDAVSVEPQVFDLLIYLVSNRDRVVTRGELLENLWKGKVVTDSALGVRLRSARKAVGDSGGRQEVIKTVHGRGYQFIADVKILDSGQSGNAMEAPISNAAVPVSDKPSIAVIPFANMSGDPEQEYFSDGITDDIIIGLSKFRELFVIARGSSFVLKGHPDVVTEAANKLGVRYVLEGSVRRAGERVRIVAQLSDATTRNQIWVESYDRVLEDVFTVQDDVTRNIVSTLAVRLEEDSRERAIRKSAANLSAYDCYLRGKHCFPDWRGSKDNILRAREMFEKALELDSDYALAYSGLAETYLSEGWSPWTPNSEAATARSFECARKAVELDNRDSHAHITLACAYFVMGNFELAEVEIQKALELNPNDYWNYCLKTEISMCCGDFEESISCANEAITRNPFLPDSCLHGRGFSEYFSQRYEDALKTLARISEPRTDVQACVAACLAQLGRIDDAVAAAAKFHARAAAEPGERSWDDKGWREYWTSRFNFKDPEQLGHLIEGLDKAGLIEKPSD